jgi:hypothetical protein
MNRLIPKETEMHYKTIVLGLLKKHAKLHNRLRRKRLLLRALDLYARELKTHHEAWKEELLKKKPGSAPSQIASEALEIALKELEDFFRSSFPTKDNEPLSLEEGMAFIRRGTPRE